MELLDPVTTKDALFLTLNYYNDTDTQQDAIVELHKNSKILDSAGTFVACESFKISVGVDGGIEYMTVPRAWRIRIESVLQDNSREGLHSQLELLYGDNHGMVPASPNLGDEPWNVDGNRVAHLIFTVNPLQIYASTVGGNNAPTLAQARTLMAIDMQKETFAPGCTVQVSTGIPDATGAVHFHKYNLLTHGYLVSNGFGRDGMQDFPVTIHIVDGNEAVIRYRPRHRSPFAPQVLDANSVVGVRDINFEEFKRYVCRGFQFQGSPHSGVDYGTIKFEVYNQEGFAYANGLPGAGLGRPNEVDVRTLWLIIKGPTAGLGADPLAISYELNIGPPPYHYGANPNIGNIPGVIFMTDQNEFATGASCCSQDETTEAYFQTGHHIINLPNETFEIAGNGDFLYRCQYRTNLQHGVGGEPNFPDPIAGLTYVGALRHGTLSVHDAYIPPRDRPQVTYIMDASSQFLGPRFEAVQGAECFNRKHGDRVMTALELGPLFDKKVYNLNQFIELFNTPAQMGNIFNHANGFSNMFTFNVDSGGCLEIKFNSHEDKRANLPERSFSISTVMSDALGLDPYIYKYKRAADDETIRVHGSIQYYGDDPAAMGQEPFIQDITNYEWEIGTLDAAGRMLYIPAAGPNPAMGVTIGNTGAEVLDTLVGPGLNPIVVNPEEIFNGMVLRGRQAYRLLGVKINSLDGDRLEQYKVPAELTEIDGIPYYRFQNPAAGDVIKSRGKLNVEMLSTYEAIQIVSHSGMLFQPQVSEFSGFNRVLASYRLPFDWTTLNDITGAVTGCTNEFYGDLLYNVSGGGSQYLKITTPGPQYDISLTAQLLYRDKNKVPRNVQIAPTGLFEVKLRFVQNK